MIVVFYAATGPLASSERNDGADVLAITPKLASAVLTKGASFVFGHLGFCQDKRDLLA